ncbi:mechanosensitive ion channel family protein [Caldisericum exile]|uniref:MscS family transporter n=1 Tax=Caldisericum exile (strain DSM 21853 / NBRC 104410 / AZM16c01) TaxID=511051 RepID=A0A7U6JFH8_CALEA|nr:mechanosensitive ion channel domain-containing protein [Caldisericum exile]BAL81528.1 putative MscS family transporter [Caldisericum exile AZM16c01]
MRLIDKILTTEIFGNTILRYLVSLLIFTILFLAICLAEKILKRIIDKIKDKKDNFGIRLTQFLFRRLGPILYVFAFLISLEQLNLQDFRSILHSLERGLIAIAIIYVLVAIIDFVYSEILTTSTLGEDQKKAMQVLMISIKVIIVLLGIIFIIKNFIPTFDITSLLTTFGIGGVIIGLGLQRIIQDVLNYFAIIFDKPFVEGEYIVTGDVQGTVSKINLRSTRLISLSGEEVNIPNSVITSQVIRNWSRLSTRRIQVNIGIAYETEKEKLEKMSEILKRAVESVEKTVFAFARFSSFGSYSLIFTLAYYINETDYNKFMELQEKVNIAIFDILKKEGIEIVYPIQVVRVEEMNNKGA